MNLQISVHAMTKGSTVLPLKQTSVRKPYLFLFPKVNKRKISCLIHVPAFLESKGLVLDETAAGVQQKQCFGALSEVNVAYKMIEELMSRSVSV